jgi:hypothetical protein
VRRKGEEHYHPDGGINNGAEALGAPLDATRWTVANCAIPTGASPMPVGSPSPGLSWFALRSLLRRYVRSPG